MKRSTTIALVTLCLGQAFGQDARLQGRVTDSVNGETLVGASVVYAPGKGVNTDLDGSYTLELPAGSSTITVSIIGYAPQRTDVTLAPGETRTLDIKLVQSSAQLDMVVVTAGKFEQRVGEVTQSLSVLRPELVRNKNVVSLDQALDQVPGVVIVDEEPQIRAGSGFSYGAGSRVQVLVDDIPILSGDVGRPNWSFLPMENLEQVEVIKGASSVLYGSAALSGVINVRTAYPRARPHTRVTAFSGIYDTPQREAAKWWQDNAPMFGGVNFFHSQQYGALDVVLGGNVFSDAGFVGPEPIPADTIAQRPLATSQGGFDQRARFNTAFRWRNKRVEGLNYGLNTNFQKSRATSVLVWADSDSGLYRPKPGTITRTLGTQYYVDPYVNYYSASGTRHSLRGRLHRQIFDNDNGQGNSNTTIYGEYQVQQKADIFGETVLTAGLVGRNTASTAELYSGGGDLTGRNQALNVAAYLQADKKLFEKIALSLGVRYERFTVNEDEAAEPVFRAGATYQVLEATFLRASYGQGFRFPTIGERYITTSVDVLRIFPNPDLMPERSWNVEGGVKQGFKIGGFSGYLDAVVFQQEFENYVEFTFGQWGNPFDVQQLLGLGFKSVNTGGARVSGYEFELAGKGRIGAVEIQALMGYTHTMPISTTPDQVYATPTYSTSTFRPSTYLNTSFDPTDNILKFRVQDLFRGDVQAVYHKFRIGMSVRYNSHVRNIDKAFIDLDDNGLLETGVHAWMDTHRTGDWLLDGRVGMDLNTQIRLAFLVNNITNEEYSLRPLSIEAPRSMQVVMSVEL
ncbi:MAG: TonB-dependent receptor [Flavobacteriales bacterium]|nr:TonB-dependent receptor [Flavobacteriales bacterium]